MHRVIYFARQASRHLARHRNHRVIIADFVLRISVVVRIFRECQQAVSRGKQLDAVKGTVIAGAGKQSSTKRTSRDSLSMLPTIGLYASDVVQYPIMIPSSALASSYGTPRCGTICTLENLTRQACCHVKTYMESVLREHALACGGAYTPRTQRHTPRMMRVTHCEST